MDSSPARLLSALRQPAPLPDLDAVAPEPRATPPAIAVCIPTTGSMKALTAASLVMATNLAREVGHRLDLLIEPGPYTHWNRENLIARVLEDGAATHAIFVDCDIVFPPESLSRLAMLGHPIVGAAYNLKQKDPVSTVKMAHPDGGYLNARDEAFPDGQWPTEPFRCAALGTGLMCIDLAAIADVPRPLFPCDWRQGGDTVLGEDIAFCAKAAELGIDVWCDPTLDVVHIGDYGY